MKNNKWIAFQFVKDTGKTKVYYVQTNSIPSTKLGEIKWFPTWRKYAFFPSVDTVFENTCLQDIIDFIADLMVQRREQLVSYKK